MSKNVTTTIAAGICSVIAIALTLGSCSEKKQISGESMNTPAILTRNLNVYIENSGSMDGYMCNGSELKDAVYSYLSDLDAHTENTHLFYINSKIIPYKNNLSSYVKDLNPMSFKNAGGNRANTNIANMLDSIVSNMSDTIVSIYVSDCILDLPDGNAQDFFNRQQIAIKDIINRGRKRMPDLSVEVFKMSSKFEGMYYYPKQGVKHQKLEEVKRPYYIWVFGNKDVIADINKKVSILDLKKYGFENIISFTNNSAVSYLFSANGNGSVVLPNNRKYNFKVLADFSNTLLSDETLSNAGNYSFSNQNISISQIGKIQAHDSKYSHYILFSVPEDASIIGGEIYLNSPLIPSWVEDSNDDTGINIDDNMNKTTGIKYLINGVAEAYKKETILTSMKFNIKRL